MIPTVASVSVLGDGPTLRVNGPSVATNSSSIPSYLSMTIPSQAQVDDYIVICTSNGTTIDESYSRWSRWRRYDTGNTTGGTYNENCTIHVTICEAADIGDTVRIKAGSFSFNAIMYVFSNPNKTDIANINGFTVFTYYPENIETNATKSTSNVSSLAVPAFPGKTFPPNYLRLTACAFNGSSGYPNPSYSGSGTSRTQNDSYWWRSVIGVVETGNTNSGSVGTFSCSSSAAAALTIYLT